jgi:hypothetical protein
MAQEQNTINGVIYPPEIIEVIEYGMDRWDEERDTEEELATLEERVNAFLQAPPFDDPIVPPLLTYTLPPHQDECWISKASKEKIALVGGAMLIGVGGGYVTGCVTRLLIDATCACRNAYINYLFGESQ